MKRRLVQIFFTLYLFCCCDINVFAVPAYPNKVRVTTLNGKTVVIYMRGDEYQKYAITEEGYTLISDSTGWWYATRTNAGKVEKSKFCLMAIEDETAELKNFKASCPKGIVPERIVWKPSNRIIDVKRVRQTAPIVGERRALVILMQYKDLPFKKTSYDFKELFNTLDYEQDGATGSVRDFYRFASQGQLDYISDVYGPYTSQNPMRYYGGNAYGGGDKNPLELCIEAIKNLPNNIDYSVYDNDGDGLVDNVHIIYAGYGEEAGASSEAIWAHEYPHRISLGNEFGYSFAGYSCSPELRGNIGSNITNIGVICHELGHALGAMDYYDTNYETGGGYAGTGQWDIMASGSWNDDGRTPPNFNPYVRSNVFGWNTLVTLDTNQHIVMPRMEIDNPEQTVIYKLETGSDGDYFLLENRQKYRFDTALPGAGLIIYHVHPDLERYNTTNSVNATHPQKFYPVCASYSEPNKKKYGNINSAECPFPGSSNVKSFTSGTSPVAVAWNGSAAKASILDIAMSTSNGSVSFTTGEDFNDESDFPDLPIDKNLIYQESFEGDIDKRMSISLIKGNEKWRTYAKGDFAINPDMIPNPTDKESILMLYVSKGAIMSESEIISTDIEVETGANYTITFDIYCEAGPTGIVPTFNLLVEDEYGEYNIYTLSKATNEWMEVGLPLTFAANKFRYKLYGRANTGAIFVDNIRLYKEIPSSIFAIEMILESEDVFIYTLNGLCIGKFSNQYFDLKPGIYIIRQGNIVRKLFVK